LQERVFIPRDPGEKPLAKARLLFSVSGLSELGDEAVAAWIALVVGAKDGEVRKITGKSRNHIARRILTKEPALKYA
jgi:hypothetical protein